MTEIEHLLVRHADDDQTAVKALWTAAMNASGRDNITVVLVRVSQDVAAETDDPLGPQDPDC